jgi:soluble lytic murein transglycosylase-like protein
MMRHSALQQPPLPRQVLMAFESWRPIAPEPGNRPPQGLVKTVRGVAALGTRRFDMNASGFWLTSYSAALRVFSLTRGLLALVGIAAVAAVALPGPREALIRDVAALTRPVAEGAAGNVTAGPIHAGATESAREREQRAVTEFIAGRYRVAQEAVAGFVASAYRAGAGHRVDPLLVLAVMAVESRYNPVAESVLGAKGLMQVLAKFHQEKLLEHGGEAALLDPDVNIQVGTQILREYLHRFGETETALQMYAGAFDEPTSQYARKVLAERARLEQTVARQRRAA